MTTARPIALIGPMGAGKSAVGRRLAERLGLAFRDTDELIVQTHGPIEAIFAEQGEARFRELEAEVVAEALGAGGVVSLGGGAVLDGGTRARLASAAVVLLDVDESGAAPRLAGGRRPLIAQGGIAAWARIRAERMPLYTALAGFAIDTSALTTEQAVDAVAEALAAETAAPQGTEQT